MPRNTIYLEAPARTQDVLNVKWTLRAAGYAIGSTWHDIKLNTPLLAFQDHGTARALEQLQVCDSLVVICGTGDPAAPELGMRAGFALARGIRVFWIGAPLCALSDFPAVQRFNTAEDFRKQILQQVYSDSLTRERLAA